MLTFYFTKFGPPYLVKVTDWRHDMGKESGGNPKARWIDDIQKTTGPDWKSMTFVHNKWGGAYPEIN